MTSIISFDAPFSNGDYQAYIFCKLCIKKRGAQSKHETLASPELIAIWTLNHRLIMIKSASLVVSGLTTREIQMLLAKKIKQNYFFISNLLLQAFWFTLNITV